MYGLFHLVDSVVGYFHISICGAVCVFILVSMSSFFVVFGNRNVIETCGIVNDNTSNALGANGLAIPLAMLVISFLLCVSLCVLCYGLSQSVHVAEALTQCRSYLADVRLCQVRHAD